MAKIVGQLSDIVTKQFRNGGDAVYIVVNSTEYKFGKYAPRGFSKGDFVEFEATSKPNGQYENWTADYKTLRKVDASAVGNTAPAPAFDNRAGNSPSAAGSGRAGNFGDDRQETISKQAALNTSHAFFKAMVDAGAITPPTSVKKGQLLTWYKEVWHAEAAACYKLATGKTWDISPDKEAAPDADDFVQDELPSGDSW